MDLNLASGSLTLAARGKDFAIARFLRSGIRGEGQIAFGGYDGQIHSVATSHGLGRALLRPAWVVPRAKDDWVVFWFDPQGLALTHTGWAANANTVGHFGAVSLEEADRFTLNTTTPDGPLLGVSPLSPQPDSQLGVFLFNPGDTTAEIVKAVGATHHAKKAKFPAVSRLGDGYVVAWLGEEDDGTSRVTVTRLDSNGREPSPQIVLSTPGRAASAPSLAVVDGITTVAWSERSGSTDEVVVQALDRSWQPGNPQRVDRGTNPVLLPMKSGTALAFLRQGTEAAQAAIVLVDSAGMPMSRGLLMSDDKAKSTIKDSPALALTDEGWLAIGFTYSEGTRAWLRSVKIECLGGDAKPAGSASGSASAAPAGSASAVP